LLTKDDIVARSTGKDVSAKSTFAEVVSGAEVYGVTS
jgi:hypothetical protein